MPSVYKGGGGAILVGESKAVVPSCNRIPKQFSDLDYVGIVEPIRVLLFFSKSMHLWHVPSGDCLRGQTR